MKLNRIKAKVLDGADAAALEAAVAAFVGQQSEREFVSAQYVLSGDGATRSVLLLYTE